MIKWMALSKRCVENLSERSSKTVEWNAIGEEIDPTQLRYTKLCNSAIDNIPQKRAETIGVLASYIETDLVCYRSESPAKLTDAQEALWSPLVDWFEKTRGVRLISTTGILPVEQPREAKDVTQAWLERLDNYALMAVHDLVIMSGSMVLAMAVVEREISAEDAWNRSILDEVSQEELWGTDAESISSRRSKSQDFDIAAQFYFSLIE